MLLLAAALAVSLAACGKGPEADAPAPGGSLGGEKHKAEQTPDRSGTVQTVTYWTAVRQERYNAAYDRTETSAMPTEKWWADLYLNGDGTAQFREVLGQSCLFSLTGGAWQQEADGALRLTGLDPVGDSVTMEGRREADGAVTLEDPYGSRFYLEPAERPAPGGELCLADLSGTWRMTGLRTGDRTCGMEELHAASLLTLHPRWSDLDGGRYVLEGEYYRADGLDTDAPEYRTVTELAAEYRAEPLTEGLANELWSAELSREDSDTELLVTLTDRNTLYLREPGEGDGGTAVYTRSDSFLPEPLTEALAEEPGGALLFLWRDPAGETAEGLAALPVTALEEHGRNRLLVVGRWYETELRFCTGTRQVNPDGTQGDWLTEEVVYEGAIRADEPRWFSLTIPEGTPALCLFMKRPWDETWFTWPLTDAEPCRVSGHTFLLETG